jgi:hypothetical protein
MISAARSAPRGRRRSSRRATRRGGYRHAVQHGSERRGHRVGAVPAAVPAAKAGGVEARRGIELVEDEWRDQARFAGAQDLGAGAESAVVDDGGRGGKQPRVRRRSDDVQVAMWRHRGRRATDQHTPAAESVARAGDSAIALDGVQARRRAEPGDHRRIAVGEKVVELARQRLDRIDRVEDEAAHLRVRRVIGCGWAEPFRPDAEVEVGVGHDPRAHRRTAGD